MEKATDWEQKTLLNELTQGKELACLLRKHLHPSSSPQTRQILLKKLLSSYDKALSMLSRSGFAKSGISLCFGMSLEDGYCWRKYGQKNILGSNFSRSYYRCTNRQSQGCSATKQVQRSNKDPTLLEVNYKGTHTCNKSVSQIAAPLSIESNEESSHYRPQKKQKQSRDMFMNFEAGLKVKTEDREDIFPSFCFPLETEEVKNGLFVETLISPVTSESNNILVSPCHMGSFEYHVTDIMSAPTSVNNSAIGDLDISLLDMLEFDPSFPFYDNPELFS